MKIDFQNFKIDKLLPTNTFESDVLDFIKVWFSNEKYVSVKTSGSTGNPKIIKVEKEKMRNSANLTCDFLNLKTGNSALLCLPIEYISGKMVVARAIERNLFLYIENTSLQPLTEFTKNVEFCAMTPLQVENSLGKIHLIKKLIIGGAKVSDELKLKIQEQLISAKSETEVYETFGMSETLSHVALKQIAPNPEEFFTVFKGIEISKDERDCLRIFAPMLNSEVLQTNDIVEIKNQNQFRFIGRADFIINSGGLKISPEILEKIVKMKISNELLFVGIKDELLGEKLVLVIEGKSNSTILDKIENLEFPTKNHRPREVLFLEKFPRSENGKILRLEIKKMIENNG